MGNKEKTKKFVLERLRAYPTSQFSEAFIRQTDISYLDLLEASMDKHQQTAFRAAWLLEHILLDHPQLLSEFYTDFLRYVPVQQNWSCIRSYSKILMLATQRNSSIRHTTAQEELIIEHTFKWLIAPGAPVAGLVNCMDVLYNLSSKHPWVSDELAAQIKFLLKNPTAALASRGNRILKRILNT